MRYIDERTRDSISTALSGDVVGSDFRSEHSKSDGSTVYSQEIEIEELENELTATFDPVKGAIVFEFVWVNFASVAGPTTDDIMEEIQILPEIRDEIERIAEETPYQFANGVLNREGMDPTSKKPAVSTAERFTPSVLYEGDSMRMSIGLAHEDTMTPF